MGHHVIDPESVDLGETVRTLAVGAQSVDDAHAYGPEPANPEP